MGEIRKVLANGKARVAKVCVNAVTPKRVCVGAGQIPMCKDGVWMFVRLADTPGLTVPVRFRTMGGIVDSTAEPAGHLKEVFR